MRTRTLATKQQILEGAGFAYNFNRELYVNRKTKKVISMDFIEERTEAEIEQFIRQKTDGKKWLFCFISPPVPGVRRELESMLG